MAPPHPPHSPRPQHPQPPNKVLYIGNLPSDTNSAGINVYFFEIYSLVNTQPGLIRVKILLNHNQIGAYALAYFDSIENATAAMEALKDAKAPGTQKPLEVTYATSPKKGSTAEISSVPQTPTGNRSPDTRSQPPKDGSHPDISASERAPNTRGPGLLGDKPLPIITPNTRAPGSLGDRPPPIIILNDRTPRLPDGRPINGNTPLARYPELLADPPVPKAFLPLPRVTLPKWAPNNRGPRLVGDKEFTPGSIADEQASPGLDSRPKDSGGIIMRGMAESSYAAQRDKKVTGPTTTKKEEKLKESGPKERKFKDVRFKDEKGAMMRERELRYHQGKHQDIKEFLTQREQIDKLEKLQAIKTKPKKEFQKAEYKEEGQTENANAHEPRVEATNESEAEREDLEGVKLVALKEKLAYEEYEHKPKEMEKGKGPVLVQEGLVKNLDGIKHGQGNIQPELSEGISLTDRMKISDEKEPVQKVVKEAPYVQKGIQIKETSNIIGTPNAGASASVNLATTFFTDGKPADMCGTVNFMEEEERGEELVVTEGDWDDAF